ncbi:MAG: hypothetical protein K8T10_22235 [Candidatus Eremiobacteraeota bacterium]|nr:hypothetical protein [Candidatus Eremiobacteraeota bacterium]
MENGRWKMEDGGWRMEDGGLMDFSPRSHGVHEELEKTPYSEPALPALNLFQDGFLMELRCQM